MQVGSFTLEPSIQYRIVSNDNIFSDDETQVSDLISRYGGSLALTSNWANHEVGVSARGSADRFADNTAENASDTDLSAFGTVDITRETAVSAEVGLRQFALSRNAADTTTGLERLRVDSSRGALELSHKFSKAQVEAFTRLRRDDFDDAIIDTNLSNQRDRDTLLYGARISTLVGDTPEYFVEVTNTDVDFDQETAGNDFDRSNETLTFSVGKPFRFSDKVRGDFALGYFRKDYDLTTLTDINDFTVDGQIGWQLSGLTRLSGTVARRFRETTLSDSVGADEWSFGIGVNHELLRNLRLRAAIRFDSTDFRGIDREDDDFNYELSANYDIGQSLTLNAFHLSEQRDSGGFDFGREFSSKIFGLGLTYSR